MTASSETDWGRARLWTYGAAVGALAMAAVFGAPGDTEALQDARRGDAPSAVALAAPTAAQDAALRQETRPASAGMVTVPASFAAPAPTPRFTAPAALAAPAGAQDPMMREDTQTARPGAVRELAAVAAPAAEPTDAPLALGSASEEAVQLAALRGAPAPGAHPEPQTEAAASGAPTDSTPPLRGLTLYFDFASAELSGPALAALRAEILQPLTEGSATAPRRIIVHGHADTVGGARENVALSAERAEAVASLLRAAAAGGGALDLLVIAHGERRLARTTPDGVAEAMNRRVEIVVK